MPVRTQHLRVVNIYRKYSDRITVYDVTGTEVMEEVRRLSQEVLLELFSQEKVSSDSSSEPEYLPTSAVSSTGMGSYSTSTGKYEGFGNSPINKATVTDRVRDMLESVMNLPDPKQQILKLCLEDPVGEYQPLVLPSLPVSRVRTVSTSGKACTV